jgi:hypothetical protein
MKSNPNGGGKRDLTQIVVIDRRVGLPLSKWRGHGLDFFSVVMACWVSKNNLCLKGGDSAMGIFCVTILLVRKE